MTKPRCAVFVDGANFFHLQKDRLHWWIDPKRLLHWLRQRGDVVDAYYYLAVDLHADPQQESFLKALAYMGYAVVARDLRGGPDAERRRPNLAVDIAMDMFNLIDSYDVPVLVSGDADLERPLATLRARGKRPLVVSTHGFAARELRAFAGMHWVDVQDIREQIEKHAVPPVVPAA
jgi:uncharacterized LabA/DUF88 family protein